MDYRVNVSKAEVRRRLQADGITPEAPYIEVFDYILDLVDEKAWQNGAAYTVETEEAVAALAQWYICLDPEGVNP